MKYLITAAMVLSHFALGARDIGINIKDPHNDGQNTAYKVATYVRGLQTAGSLRYFHRDHVTYQGDKVVAHLCVGVAEEAHGEALKQIEAFANEYDGAFAGLNNCRPRPDTIRVQILESKTIGAGTDINFRGFLDGLGDLGTTVIHKMGISEVQTRPGSHTKTYCFAYGGNSLNLSHHLDLFHRFAQTQKLILVGHEYCHPETGL